MRSAAPARPRGEQVWTLAPLLALPGGQSSGFPGCCTSEPVGITHCALHKHRPDQVAVSMAAARLETQHPFRIAVILAVAADAALFTNTSRALASRTRRYRRAGWWSPILPGRSPPRGSLHTVGVRPRATAKFGELLHGDDTHRCPPPMIAPTGRRRYLRKTISGDHSFRRRPETRNRGQLPA